MLRVLALITVAYAALVFWLPETTANYSCPGHLTYEGESKTSPTTYYIQINRYNPWILWASHKGNVRTENAIGFVDYHPANITPFSVAFNEKGEDASNFSPISQKIKLRYEHGLGFIGECQRM